MAPGSLKDCHIVVLNATKHSSQYTSQNLKKWIENSGGHVAFKEVLTEQTTHVVMDEDTWMEQGPFIQEIFTAENKDSSEEKRRSIHIVSFDWLGECLDHRVKRRESRFKWKNLAGKALKQSSEEKEPGTVMGLMGQTLDESTRYVAAYDEQKRMMKRKRLEAEDRADEREEESRQFEIHKKKMNIPEQMYVFKKGTKRAKADILSDNHHIYVDNTGFTLDVIITKVDFNNNANERYVLTIYETNSIPHSYAFNSRFGGTKALPRNDIISAIGSTFPTVFRAFKNTFFHHTGVQWDDRMLEFREREAKARMNNGEEVPFKDQKFEYYPPTYGPIGEIPLAQTEADLALVQAVEAEKICKPSPVVDDWKMSSGNGPRNDSPGFNEFMTSSAKESGFPPDDKLNDSTFDYPFELAGSGKQDAIVVDDDDDEEGAVESNEQDTCNDFMDTNAGSGSGGGKGPSQHADTQSYQQPAETFEFDDALDLTQSLDFLEMPNGSSQIPRQPAYTVQTQAFGQTQLAETVRAGLFSDENTQFGTGDDDAQF